jgi:2-polyprenyl-3-methyl-5-hydroxy-6-metoxy-1,4-benzoquinol methylase
MSSDDVQTKIIEEKVAHWDDYYAKAEVGSRARHVRLSLASTLLHRDNSKIITHAKRERATQQIPIEPSTFALLCKETLPSLNVTSSTGLVMEMGCGNGRDSLYFAQQGFDVAGVDIAPESIKTLQTTHTDAAGKTPAGKPAFLCADFTSLRKNPFDKKVAFVYSRFTLHAIGSKGASSFLQ